VKALVYTRPGTVEVLDIDEPHQGPDEVLIRVAAAGICGSELHGIGTPGFRTPPLVMGHEFAGTTVDGRRVVVNPVLGCGSCQRCEAGGPNLCFDRKLVGVHRPGGFAEWVSVPQNRVFDLPVAIEWSAAAVVEPLANGLHAWALSQAGPTARVAILGAGMIGLACLHAAQRHGATGVVVADPVPQRLALAARLGAEVTTSALDGEYDVIIDAAGVPEARAAAVRHLRPGGTTVWLGLGSSAPAFDALDLVRTEKRVLGSFTYTDAEFIAAIEVAADLGPAWFEPGAVQQFPLGQGADIFTHLMNGEVDILKAVLRP
jgi:threonine dehydrogenase-like Zn-dependent dehydrogenase